MRSRHVRILRFNWLRFVILVLTIGSFAASTRPGSAQLAGEPSSPIASASVDAFPDAPSASQSAPSQPAGASSGIRLEQQDHPPVNLRSLPANALRDGGHIVVSSKYVRWNDLKWMVPLAGATTAAFETDQTAMTEAVSSNPSFNQTNINVSNGLIGGFIATPVAMFGIGHLRHDERMTETGLLGSEAMVDAIAVDEVVKLCAFRERPNVDNAQGRFFIGSAGLDSSFISEHSIIAWSAAAVIAGEYRSKWTQFGVYTLAAGVSATRVMGREHFPSDVLLGAAGGWLIGHYVFRAHHHVPLEHARK